MEIRVAGFRSGMFRKPLRRRLFAQGFQRLGARGEVDARRGDLVAVATSCRQTALVNFDLDLLGDQFGRKLQQSQTIFDVLG